MRSRWRPLLLRGVPLVVVFLAGFAGLTSGVGVTERDLAAAGLAERAYYTLGLFVLGGLDIGTPVGGPTWGRVVLWFAYFGAPLITATALFEAVARVVSPLALRIRPLRGHIVLAGAGRLTRVYVRKLRKRDPGRAIVVVERDPNNPFVAELRDRHKAIVILGDITSDDVLAGLRLDRARRLLLLTADDFTNLDAAAKALRMAPGLEKRIVIHVSDPAFIRETAHSSVARASEIFNGHEFAAVHLVQEHLLARFHATPDRDLVVLAGFGRFGRTVLDQLQQHAKGRFGRVVIVDTRGALNARAFDESPGFADDYDRTVIDGDLLDPQIWHTIGNVVREHGHDPVVVVGSGNDGTNLHAALLARRQYPGAYVIVRSFRASPFTEEIAEDIGVHAFSLAELIDGGMPARWF